MGRLGAAGVADAGLKLDSFSVRAVTPPKVASAEVTDPDPGTAVVHGLRLFPLRFLQYANLFVASLVVAKALGPEGRAAYALPTVLASSVIVVVHLTATEAAGRLMAHRTASMEHIVRTLYALSIGLSAAGGVLFLLSARLLEGAVIADATAAIVFISLGMIPPAIVTQMATGVLVRNDRLRALVRISALGAVVQAVGVIVLDLAFGLTPELAAVALVVSASVTAVGLTFVVGRTLGVQVLRPMIDRGVLRPLLRVAAQLHPGTLALFLTMRADLLLMATLTDDHEVGLYSLAVTLGELALFAAIGLSQAAMHHQTHETEQVAGTFTAAFVRQSWPIVAAFNLVLTLAAWPGVVLVYGAQWEPAVPALIILSWAVAAIAVTGPLPIYLMRSVRPLKLAGAAALALVANVTLVIALVPPLGATGAALASLGAYWLYAARLIQLMHRHHGVGIREMLARPQTGDPILAVIGRRGR